MGPYHISLKKTYHPVICTGKNEFANRSLAYTTKCRSSRAGFVEPARSKVCGVRSGRNHLITPSEKPMTGGISFRREDVVRPNPHPSGKIKDPYPRRPPSTPPKISPPPLTSQPPQYTLETLLPRGTATNNRLSHPEGDTFSCPLPTRQSPALVADSAAPEIARHPHKPHAVRHADEGLLPLCTHTPDHTGSHRPAPRRCHQSDEF